MACSPTSALFIVRNITDRKQAEAALRHSEATNRALITAIPDLLIRASGAGQYLDIIGRDRVLNISDGYTVTTSLPSDRAKQRMAAIQTALTTGTVQVYEHEISKGEDTRYEEVRIVVSGENEVLIMVRDITQRKQAEAALRIAEETYRGIFENALDGIFQSTPEGFYLRVNPALAQLYGYESPADLINSISDIASQVYVQPSDRESFKHLIEQEGMVTELEYQVYRADGSIIWISESTSAVRDDHGHLLYYAGIIQDISDRKRREAELRRQLEELRIEIDQKKRQQEVVMITESGYFQELQQEIAEVNLDEFWS